jgi:hypothetical protein
MGFPCDSTTQFGIPQTKLDGYYGAPFASHRSQHNVLL